MATAVELLAQLGKACGSLVVPETTSHLYNACTENGAREPTSEPPTPPEMCRSL